MNYRDNLKPTFRSNDTDFVITFYNLNYGMSEEEASSEEKLEERTGRAMSSGSNQWKIISALESLVEKRRIVFCYDESGEMKETVKSLSLPGIEVMKLDRNPLSVKYRILKEEMPERGYIVYSRDSRLEKL